MTTHNIVSISEEIDYNFVERAESDLFSIRILTGKYAGVIYTYGRVAIKENQSSGTATLSFDYKVEDTEGADQTMTELNEDPDFKNHLGDILTNILSNGESKIGKHDRE